LTIASTVRKNGKKSEKCRQCCKMLTNLQKIFCCVAVETLVGVETGEGGGGGAGS
jgi:hypothetical protein